MNKGSMVDKKDITDWIIENTIIFIIKEITTAPAVLLIKELKNVTKLPIAMIYNVANKNY